MSKVLVLEDLKGYLKYEEDTGRFFWYRRPAHNICEGEAAGSVNGEGYIDIMFKGRSYGAARLAVYFKLGFLPERVDHIDTDRLNNRWTNLRVATQAQNSWNRSMSSLNTSGVKGLSINAGYRYMCKITKKGKTYYKYFPLDRKEDAISWLRTTRQQLHGEFTNHG